MSLKEDVHRARFVLALIGIIIIYFIGNWYGSEADISELKKWNIPDISKIKEPVKLLIQGLVAAIIIITVFYIGKFHDYSRDYLKKLGDFKECLIRYEKINKPKTKKLEEISKKEEHFNDQLEIHKKDSGLTISITMGVLIIISFLLVKIFTEDFTDVRENFLYTISLGIFISYFFLQWSFLDYKINNRQDFFRELLYDLAEIKAFLR